MDQHKKSIFSRLINVISSVIFCVTAVALFTAISQPLFAQTAEVKKVGVYYKEGNTLGNNASLYSMYCDNSTETTYYT